MLIECSNCASVYRVALSMIGEKGRRFRCASCRHVWHVEPSSETECAPEVELDNEEDLESRLNCGLAEAVPMENGGEIRVEASSERAQPATYEELYADGKRSIIEADTASPSLPKWKWPMPGLSAAILLIASGMGLVSARASIVRMEPMSSALFAAIHLPVNLSGLDLHDVTSSVQKEGNQQVLAISGTIINVSRHLQRVPQLQISVRDKEGRSLYTWTAKAMKSSLNRGETLAFHARLAAPPAGASAVAVHFATLQLAMGNH